VFLQCHTIDGEFFTSQRGKLGEKRVHAHA